MMAARATTWMLLAIALLAAAFEFVALPTAEALAQSRASAAQAKDDFRWMRENVTAAVAANVTTTGTDNPLQALEAALVRAGVRGATERIERRDDNAVISLREADFGGVLRWLALAEQELGLSVLSMQLAPDTRKGTVSGTVVLATNP